MSITSPIEVKFTGFRPGTHAAAIHATLRNTPRTKEQIIRETQVVAKKRKIKNPAKRVRDHIRHWARQKVYVQTSGRAWTINPRGVRFVPREWAP